MQRSNLIQSLVAGLLFTSLHTHAADYIKENTFTAGIEGPAVDAAGNLYAVNFAEEGTIGIISGKDSPALFLKLPKGSVANGIVFDRKGLMYLADYTGHNILRVTPADKSVAIYAHESRMNQPNDLAITGNGVIYASDPNWKNNTGRIWMVSTDAKVVLLEEGMGTTNGIEVSVNDAHLYVNESVQRKVWKYDIDTESGLIKNKQLLIEFKDHGLDGMRSDNKGNLYIARFGAGEIAVVSPEGKLINTIALKGKRPTNVAFGGVDGRRLFVTLQDRGMVEFFDLDIPGKNWPASAK
ncbi:SMP-30/gluconolactonase/LRE family protein [Chitinilyticum litopenaei]|uniref:SMP-30/gluconolactonase/LRE family protein n=1 Tax=Chitinilyticum litopenaei TaxID=1121276 RepID=UPI0004011585|nr:SMP-30/gluconolactonase/LRE family protein [Chitinilyticum litopenaei]